MRKVALTLATVCLLASIATLTPVHAQDGPYKFSKEIVVGGEGGWDYLSIDAPAHRLYVAHATKVVVIDTQAAKVVGELPDTPGVHGFEPVPELGRGFSSNGREDKVGIWDLKTLKLIQKVETGGNPDGIMYEPSKKEIWTFNGRGKSSTVIDAQTGKVVATVPLEGKPEAAQADSKAGKIYVNMEDLNAIKVIDIATHKVTATWPIAPGEGATGLAFDVATHRLFVACDKFIVMMDSTNGKVVYTVPAGEGVDAAAFDPGTKYAFASAGETGIVTIAHEDSASMLKVVQTLKTRQGARTMTLDPLTHAIYLATTDYEPRPAGSKERPKAVAGTFRVLVYQMTK